MSAAMLIVFSATTLSQDYGQSHMRKNKLVRWSTGVMLSPDWEGRFFKGENDKSFDGTGPGSSSTQNKMLADLMRDNEHAGLSFTAGAHVLYDINRRWFARLGIYYSNKKIKSSDFITTYYTLSGFYKIPSAGSSSDFPFIELPLTFHYILNKPFDKGRDGTCYTSYTQFNRKKPLFYLFAGPAYALNLNKHFFPSRTFTIIADTVPVYIDKMKLNQFGFYAGIGIMRYFNDHIFLTAEPVFRFFPVRWYSKKFREQETDLNPYPKAVTYHVKDKPWSVGLQVSLNYHF